MEYYKNYVGHFVKRFYAPFREDAIYKIKEFRENKFGTEEFLYSNGKEEWWTDCEDSCIITNEIPVLNIDWVANVNSEEYKGFNPFLL